MKQKLQTLTEDTNFIGRSLAILLIIAIIILAMFVSSCTTLQPTNTVEQYLIVDKYIETDMLGHEYYYVKIKQLSNNAIKIEKLYDHQIDMYSIGDVLTVDTR